MAIEHRGRVDDENTMSAHLAGLGKQCVAERYAASGWNAWAVGCTRTFGNINARPLVLHWNGAVWN
jgi:hypothetical protein